MSKVYAVIQPAFTDDGSSAGLIAPFVSLFHMAAYERICGYSLGQKIHFFDTLEAAQDFIMPRTGSKSRWMNLRLQDAVIEFDVNNEEVTGYGSIYEVKQTREVLKKTELEGDFFEKVKVPVWSERDILSSDVSANAGYVLMREMKNSEFVIPAPRREPKTTAVISGGMGSSACTIFRNGAKAIAKDGVVIYTDPNGKRTVQEGNGYVGTGSYDANDEYHVDFKVVSRK